MFTVVWKGAGGYTALQINPPSIPDQGPPLFKPLLLDVHSVWKGGLHCTKNQRLPPSPPQSRITTPKTAFARCSVVWKGGLPHTTNQIPLPHHWPPLLTSLFLDVDSDIKRGATLHYKSKSRSLCLLWNGLKRQVKCGLNHVNTIQTFSWKLLAEMSDYPVIKESLPSLA